MKPRLKLQLGGTGGPHAVVLDPGMPKVNSLAYGGASWSHPDMRNWNASSGSADSDILPEQPVLRNRARDLTRNHGVASSAQQTILDNVLGCGMWLAPMPNYTAMNKTREWATEWRKVVKAKWKEWAETPLCDAAETLTLDGLASQVFNGAWVNGEGLALPLWMPAVGASRAYTPATKIQVIESDRLSNPNDQTSTTRLRGGIEINEFGAPQAYHIRNAHPGDSYWFVGDQFPRWTRIPAKTAWGRKRVIHAFDKSRGEQNRGVPALSAVLSQFKVLGDYQRAELKAAVTNAMVSLVTESSIGQEGLVELLSDNKDAFSQYVDGLTNRNRASIGYREGLIIPLALGEKISGFSPARPSTAYDPFVTTVFRHIATGLNIPYELLMKDFSKTNYSSARASMLEAWRFFIGRRNWLAMSFYQVCYELWLEEMVNAGEIEAPDYYAHQTAYSRARWIGPGKGWVDPLKEMQASELRMGQLVSTLEDECAEQGKDYLDVLEQAADEDKLLKKLGLQRSAPKNLQAKGSTDDETPPGKNTPEGRDAAEVAEPAAA